MNLPGDSIGLPYSTLSDQRATRLSQFDLFEVDRVDDATHYRSRLLEQWEPTDLGRRAFFTLRRARARWESRPNLTAVSVMSTLRAFIDPASPAYDERFASYVDGVQLRSPLELEIRFSHAPPRLEPLFRFPIYAPGGSAAGDGASNGSAGHSGLGPVLTRRFEALEPVAGRSRLSPRLSATGRLGSIPGRRGRRATLRFAAARAAGPDAGRCLDADRSAALGLRADPQGHALFLPRLRDSDDARAAAQSAQRAAQESRAAFGAFLRHRRSANLVAADPPRPRIQGGAADDGALCHDELRLQRPADPARIQHGHGLRPARRRGQATDQHSATQAFVRTRSRSPVGRRRDYRAVETSRHRRRAGLAAGGNKFDRDPCSGRTGATPVGPCLSQVADGGTADRNVAVPHGQLRSRS